MPPRISGVKNDVIRQLEEEFETDRYGVDTCTLKHEVPDSQFPRGVLANFAEHPRFPSMTLTRRSGRRSRPGFWGITYTFEGFLSTLPEPVYELAASMNELPIQLHPDFESKIAGKPSAPKNGAIFLDPETQKITTDDEKGVWREFRIVAGAEFQKGGIESYLVPGAEWREISFSNIAPNTLSNMGEINPPPGSPPNLEGHNWLYVGMTYTRRGFIYQITKTWRLSGKGGWDPDIY